MLSSTAAMAATAVPAPQVDPWAVLTAMSGGAPAAAMCGAAAAAATTQPTTGCVLPVIDAVPPPPPQVAAVAAVPPVAVAGGGLGISPIILGLLAIAAGIGIYLAVHNNNHGNSPA
ncbi:MAG: hypothetical protein ACJ8FT_04635 [Sphingomonas sp.]